MHAGLYADGYDAGQRVARVKLAEMLVQATEHIIDHPEMTALDTLQFVANLMNISREDLKKP